MNVHEALNVIQTELKAPKNLYNKFGKYKYRNFEGICEAVKPLLKKTNTTLIVTDDVFKMGDRHYVRATAELHSVDDNSYVTAYAVAREPLEKKGMDDAQITGATSSYARKYCLNGLFLLDDTKDPDTDEYHEQTTTKDVAPKDRPVLIPTEADKNKKAVKEQIEQIRAMCKDKLPEQYIADLYKKKSIEDLTMIQAYSVINSFDQFVQRYEKEEIPFN